MAVDATLNLTPAMKQYVAIKEKYPDCILLYRMGDFYEMFFEDALLAAPILEITLTSRNKSKEDAVPLCGFPYHAASAYIAKLVEKGFKVAVCEQVEDPKSAKGIVKRGVIRVITPGLVLDEENLKAGENNYLACLAASREAFGLAFLDLSTGEFQAGEFAGRDALLAAAGGLAFRELLIAGPFPDPVLVKLFEAQMPAGCVNLLDRTAFNPDRADEILEGELSADVLARSGLQGRQAAKTAAAAILNYVSATQMTRAGHISEIREYAPQRYLVLDETARRNLEIFAALQDGGRAGTLFALINETLTPMGARRLRWWMGYPLIAPEQIRARLAAVAEIKDNHLLRADLRKTLAGIYDLERLAGRVALAVATPRDLVALKVSLAVLPRLQEKLADFTAPALAAIRREIRDCGPLVDLLARAIVSDPPPRAQDGGFIGAGFDEELDRLRSISRDGKKWIASLEARERQATGIASLKIGFNSVFGYYIEVTKANAALVPDSYIRKQTLVNAERYITPDLKEYESLILNADERLLEIEQRLFREMCDQVLARSEALLRTARALAHLDVFASLAEVAARENYTRPQLSDDDVLDIRDGRHPVVERTLRGERFVPNDTHFDDKERLHIITGPNMAGKSTIIRQVALVVLMAQIGSFVPAREATIGLADRIFTRIGAQDEIHAGQSTFMVEMVELALILTHATSRSLIILDEIGRGTSTYDGMAIARAVVEHIHNNPRLRARTLFATHYHELTELANILPGVRNYNVAVAEEGDNVVFLHRLMPGGADRSYGIHVAQLAGIPKAVINRATEILEELEEAGGDFTIKPQEDSTQTVQLSFFKTDPDPVIKLLRDLKVDELSPLDAITKLYELKRLAGE